MVQPVLRGDQRMLVAHSVDSVRLELLECDFGRCITVRAGALRCVQALQRLGLPSSVRHTTTLRHMRYNKKRGS